MFYHTSPRTDVEWFVSLCLGQRAKTAKLLNDDDLDFSFKLEFKCIVTFGLGGLPWIFKSE